MGKTQIALLRLKPGPCRAQMGAQGGGWRLEEATSFRGAAPSFSQLAEALGAVGTHSVGAGELRGEAGALAGLRLEQHHLSVGVSLLRYGSSHPKASSSVAQRAPRRSPAADLSPPQLPLHPLSKEIAMGVM